MFTRTQITPNDLDSALELVRACMIQNMEKNGYGAFVSPHECLGVITEEYQELVFATQQSSRTQVIAPFCNELLDLASAAIFGLASAVTNITPPTSDAENIQPQDPPQQE